MKTKLLTLALAALTIGLLGSCKKEDPKVSVTSVTLDQTELTLTVGDEDVKLTATIAPENATDKTVSWSSDKTEFATVDTEGNVHAVAPGTANITVTTTDGNKTATCAVTVKAAKVPVTGVTLDRTTLEITVGDDDVKLVATVTPENATDKTVSWSSDKTDVATVDNQGNVHAVAPGTANITVITTDCAKTATCAVTVKAALPAGALPGVFSVSATKQVHFSKGNLYADGDKALHFEANQYSSASSWDASHVSLFTWSSTVEAAVGNTNSGNNLFCDESNKVSVDGSEAIYYALSKDEWVYLINKNNSENIRKGKYQYGVTVCEKENCLILAPDECLNGYSFDKTKTNYSVEEWATAEAAGLVCLPAAGIRGGSNVDNVGVSGYYWSSTAYNDSDAYYVRFIFSNVVPNQNDLRDFGYSVRLITESK